jgi:SAM-dependent methyltransferase
VVGRPSYPAAAIDALFEGMGDPAALTVADLGAGTGISTRLLAERGAHVLAVEPNAAMRDAAQADVQANVTWIDASAEETGLDAASVDLVTVFQAFHWFDHPRALREIVRILRPGGRAAVVYNERDEHDPLTAEYSAIVQRFMTDDTERRRSDGLAAFAAFDAWHQPCVIEVRNEHAVTHAGLIARTRSTSYLPQTGPQADELYAAVDDLFARYEHAGSVTLVMRTIVARGDVGGDGA